MLKRLLLPLAFVIPISSQAHPVPVINFKIERYSVEGLTTAEIGQSVFRNSPVVIDGGRYGAVTRNDFSTHYSAVANSHGGCEVKNVRIVLDSTIVLPDLVRSTQSPQVLAEWERYIGALRAHEMMHANNGKYTAETLAARLFNFKSNLPCDQMKAKLDLAIDRLVQNMGAWDQQLDSTTQHGRSQGAFLRPGFQ